jgi:putative endonuclease
LRGSREKGREGETIASRFLVRKGYSIIRRNFRSSFGEIDLIAYDPKEDVLVFIEVKLRKKDSLVSPLEIVDGGKRNRVRKTALEFLKSVRIPYSGIRFDVIAVHVNGSVEVEHIENAF